MPVSWEREIGFVIKGWLLPFARTHLPALKAFMRELVMEEMCVCVFGGGVPYILSLGIKVVGGELLGTSGVTWGLL